MEFPDPAKLQNEARHFMATLPAPIRRRVNGLKALDAQTVEILKEYTLKREALARDFDARVAPLGDRRREILQGAAVTDEELAAAEATDAAKAAQGSKLEGFWLRALQHHCIVDSIVNERDAECLLLVRDVTCQKVEGKKGFTIRFFFGENKYFKQQELSKTFLMTDEEEFGLAGVEGTKIAWKPKMDLTQETTTKGKGKKAKSVTEPCMSFFRFFGDDEEDDQEEWYSLAETLKEKIIPFAVEYYTGEAPDGSSDLDDDEDFGDDEEDDDDEDGEGVDMQALMRQMAAARGRGGRGGGGGRGGAAGGEECKQQ